MVGLVSPTVAVYREPDPPEDDSDKAQTIVVQPDANGVASLSVEPLADGGAIIDLNPLAPKPKPSANAKFYDNLAETIGEHELGTLADELLRGIEDDEKSRKDWLEDRAEGIKLLALKIEKPSGNQGGASGSVDNTSRTRHTLLLEAALRFQANARSELLPTDGPVKVENADGGDTIEGDELAQALEDDMNYYMTVTASEYYPDTDRMLLWTGVGGSGFKKVYRCPIRRRPVSESVDAKDLCVSNAATDLLNADRVTFTTRMRQSVMKRMQHLKVYRKVDLSQPSQPVQSAVDEETAEITGVRVSMRLEDAPFTICECYCMIDVPGDEHKENGEPTGLPRPYKVTIDQSSRQILEIRRNWREDDDMERPRETFVKFPFVPGFGFYDLGLIHIAGNPTVAATALLRIMIDNGIFSNFPGFLFAKGLAKQNTVDISVPPGGGAPIDVSMIPDGDIRKAIMNLPYQPTNQAAMALFQSIVESGSKIAGSPDIAVGEGKQDAPVGTTIAMIEQATKVVDAVHKRLHQGQSKEFELIVDLFRENPADFWRFNTKKNTGSSWDAPKLLKALNDYNLVPRADPNTSSNIQRIMRAQALYMMAKANPEQFQVSVVRDYVLRTLGIKNPDSMTQPAPQGPPPPSLADNAKMMQTQADQTNAQAKMADVQLRAQNNQFDNQNKIADRNADLKIAAVRLKTEETIHGRDLQADAASQASAQQHDTQKHAIGLTADAQQQQQGLGADLTKHATGLGADLAQHATGLASDHAMQAVDHLHQQSMAAKVAEQARVNP